MYVRRAITKLGMSEVSLRSGVPTSTLSRIANGHRRPGLWIVRRVEKATGIEASRRVISCSDLIVPGKNNVGK